MSPRTAGCPSTTPANSWGTAGQVAGRRSSRRTRRRRARLGRGHHRGARARTTASCLCIRTADSKTWIKDDGQDFHGFPRRGALQRGRPRAWYKQRGEEARRAKKRKDAERAAKRKHARPRLGQKSKHGGTVQRRSSRRRCPSSPRGHSAQRVERGRRDSLSRGRARRRRARVPSPADPCIASCGAEPECATRSLMHRYNAGADLLPGVSVATARRAWSPWRCGSASWR